MSPPVSLALGRNLVEDVRIETAITEGVVGEGDIKTSLRVMPKVVLSTILSNGVDSPNSVVDEGVIATRGHGAAVGDIGVGVHPES